MKIAYVFYTDDSPISVDEHGLVLEFLCKKGLDIHKEEWADETVDWKQYNCIVLKSPWDYVEKTEQFYRWLDKIQSLNIAMLNSAKIVKWNSDKHYLEDIQAAGLKIIPTSFLEKGTGFEPEKYFGTNELIVKPCVSGASKNTFKISAGSNVDAINSLLQQEAMMVQPYIPQINTEGEWSLVFFGGQFSHALLKTPVKEDFRSQPEYGGIVQGREPAPGLLYAATQYVTQFASDCLYARVDGLMIDDEFHLMELELIDPVLYLSIYPGGYENYYEALKKLLAQRLH